MREGADVIVVGGGIIGCAIARELAARGARVRLFEARTVAAARRQASAGILAPYIEGHERGPLFDLTLRSLAMYDDFIARASEGAAVDIEYRRCGSLEIAADDATADAFRRAAGDGRRRPAVAERRRRPATRTRRSLTRSAARFFARVARLCRGLVAHRGPRLGRPAARRRARNADAMSGRIRASRRHELERDGGRWRDVDGEARRRSHRAAGLGNSSTLDPAARAVRPVRGQLLQLAWKGRRCRT